MQNLIITNEEEIEYEKLSVVCPIMSSKNNFQYISFLRYDYPNGINHNFIFQSLPLKMKSPLCQSNNKEVANEMFKIHYDSKQSQHRQLFQIFEKLDEVVQSGMKKHLLDVIDQYEYMPLIRKDKYNVPYVKVYFHKDPGGSYYNTTVFENNKGSLKLINNNDYSNLFTNKELYEFTFFVSKIWMDSCISNLENKKRFGMILKVSEIQKII